MSAEEPITEADPLVSDQIDQREEQAAGMGLLAFIQPVPAGRAQSPPARQGQNPMFERKFLRPEAMRQWQNKHSK